MIQIPPRSWRQLPLISPPAPSGLSIVGPAWTASYKSHWEINRFGGSKWPAELCHRISSEPGFKQTEDWASSVTRIALQWLQISFCGSRKWICARKLTHLATFLVLPTTIRSYVKEHYFVNSADCKIRPTWNLLYVHAGPIEFPRYFSGRAWRSWHMLHAVALHFTSLNDSSNAWCHQIQLWLMGLRPRPRWGSLQRSLRPPNW